MHILRPVSFLLLPFAAVAVAAQSSGDAATAQQRRAHMEAAIHREVAGFAGSVYLYARNIDTGAEYSLRGDERVRTASTIKLPLMAGMFVLASEGKLRWDQPVVLHDADKVSGSGILSEFSDGTRLPLRDVMHLMIVVSDNTATNLILDHAGGDLLNARIGGFGMQQTRVMRKVRGDGTQLKDASGWTEAGKVEANKRFGLGVTTPHEMVTLLEKIERGQIASPAACQEMIAVLKRQQYKDGIGRHTDFDVASKSGSLDALRSDVGIVYTPRGRIAIAITVDDMPKTDYSPDNVGDLLISRLTGHLLDGLMR